MIHPFATRLCAVASLGACLFALTLGTDALPTPPAQPLELVRWWSAADPALAFGGVLRLVAFALCGWLLVVTAIELVATATGWSTLAHVARRAAPAAWRILVLRPVTAGTLAVPLLAPMTGLSPTIAVAQQADATTADESDVPVVITMSVHDDGPAAPPPTTSSTAPTAASSTSTTTSAPPPTVVVTIPEDLHEHPYPDVPPTTSAPVVTPPPPVAADPGAAPPSAPSPAPAPPASDQTYTVVPGDSFWRIAAVRVEAHLRRVPEPSEIATYWRALIAANEDRLAVPGNPDLIFPGDQLVLPAV